MAAIDKYERRALNALAPALEAAAVVPNDGVDLTYVTRGIYIGTTGNMKVTMKEGGVVTFKNLAAGIAHPMRVSRVWATDTTATDVIALF